MAYTPGPWKYQRTLNEDFLGDDSKIEHFPVFTAKGHVNQIVDAHNEGDAQLIAAAPELLETLKYLISGDPYIATPEVHALIAKAEGKP